jgi:hypothetical protein
VVGLAYRHTTEPLTTNFRATPIVSRGELGNIKHFRYRLEAMWDSNAIGDVARARGLKRIHYADLETLSLLGVWNQYYVHVYGD